MEKTLFTILFFIIFAVPAHARKCPVACSYISDKGIPAGGCGENSQMALLEGMANCVELVQDVMKRSRHVGTVPIDYCTVEKARRSEIQCHDYASSDAFEKKWLADTCSVRKTVRLFGLYLWSNEEPCGEEYLPDYNFNGGKFH